MASAVAFDRQRFERRKARRNRMKQRAEIFDRGSGAVSCSVTNLSETGALLRVESGMGLSEQFTLVLSDGIVRMCRVVRRAGGDIAVAFS